MDVDIIVKVDLVRDLILFLHKVELLFNGRVVFVSILSDLKEHFNHVLDTLVNVCFMEDAAELIEDCQRDRPTHLFEVLTDFSSQADGYLHGVVRRLVQE